MASVRIPVVITSAVGDPVYSDPIHVGQRNVELHISGPAANIIGFECSDDRANWEAVHSAEPTAGGPLAPITAWAVAAAYLVVYERPKWIRMLTAADAGGPRDFSAIVGIRQD